ncbi:hypothetical protein IW245_000618 [Longispora fulva]|uniref:Uncharacterized protein n=1 Tax=Longispora fulva TaxID=619741 RepID=A0A8J7G9Y3_9ACTN|nr:hypothetical protein [Longispora fulva]
MPDDVLAAARVENLTPDDVYEAGLALIPRA